MLIRILVVDLLLVLLYMTVWFVLARQRKRLDTVDAAWGGGFVLLAWATFAQRPSLPSLAIAGLVTVWGARLALHLARRSANRGEDPRYVVMSKRWRGNFWLRAYLSIFLTQGLLIVLVGLPILMAASRPLRGGAWLTLAGVVVWSAGFVVEAVADRQLARFMAAKRAGAIKDTLLSSGLWRYSRHPNYFGELLQWWAIGVIALQAGYGWIGLLGPLVLTILIVFVSGIPPIEKRRAGDAVYQEYKKRTSPLIPLPAKH